MYTTVMPSPSAVARAESHVDTVNPDPVCHSSATLRAPWARAALMYSSGYLSELTCTPNKYVLLTYTASGPVQNALLIISLGADASYILSTETVLPLKRTSTPPVVTSSAKLLACLVMSLSSFRTCRSAHPVVSNRLFGRASGSSGAHLPEAALRWSI